MINVNDTRVKAMIYRELLLVLEGGQRGDVDSEITIDQERVALKVLTDNFQTLRPSDADFLAVPSTTDENTIVITAYVTKGDARGESGVIPLKQIEISHHDYLSAKRDVQALALHPLRFLKLRPGTNALPFVTVENNSGLNLKGLDFQTHAAVATVDYAEKMQEYEQPVSNWLVVRALIGVPTFLRGMLGYYGKNIPAWMIEILGENPEYVLRAYEGSNPQTRKLFQPVVNALGLTVQAAFADAMLALLTSTGEFGNRMVDAVYGDETIKRVHRGNNKKDATGRAHKKAKNPLISGEIIDSGSVEAVDSCAEDIRALAAEVRKATAELRESRAVTKSMRKLYGRALAVLSNMPRINGKNVFIQLPRELALAKLVYDRMGYEARSSAFRYFNALGIAKDFNKEVDTTKLSDERVVKADEQVGKEANVDSFKPIAATSDEMATVIDTSGSMKWMIPIYAGMAPKMSSEKPYALFTFDEVIRYYPKSKQQVSKLTADGGATYLVPAVNAAIRLTSQKENGIVILISDLEARYDGRDAGLAVENMMPEIGKLPEKSGAFKPKILVVTDKDANASEAQDFSRYYAQSAEVYIVTIKTTDTWNTVLAKMLGALSQINRVAYSVDLEAKKIIIEKA